MKLELGETAADLPTTYTIDFSVGAAEFKRKNPPVANYCFGDPITRENFISMVVKSFAISKGKVDIQHEYLEWIRVNSGFDYISAFLSLDKWGQNILSDNEKEYIFTAIKAAKSGKHKELSNAGRVAALLAFIKELYDQTIYEEIFDVRYFDDDGLAGLGPTEFIAELTRFRSKQED